MSQFFIDGYNVIRSTDAMAAGSLQAQRERLLRFIEERKPCGRNQVTVVFDGKPGRDWAGWRGPTAVVFSEDRDADTEIKERVDLMRTPADAVVVTNDRAIQKWVRGAGARVMGCEEFLRAGRSSAPGGKGARIDPDEAKRINEDLKRIWKID
ncbi:MAG: NYN domain-containing protein [Elusimicrobia bacterium]|nr:NYN domain-containing protein [Elusimicrobiota bacterium]